MVGTFFCGILLFDTDLYSHLQVKMLRLHGSYRLDQLSDREVGTRLAVMYCI